MHRGVVEAIACGAEPEGRSGAGHGWFSAPPGSRVQGLRVPSPRCSLGSNSGRGAGMVGAQEQRLVQQLVAHPTVE